jgi:hypothetical protein
MKAKKFLLSKDTSSCCSCNSIIVKSREGGFVSQNCLKCGKPNYIHEISLPDLKCEFCESILKKDLIDKNYYYVCDKCNKKWKLSEEVPYWKDIFEYSGLGIQDDFVQ